MKFAKIISLLGIVIMASGICYALFWGNFSIEGAKIISMPWGIVSLIDLYTGFKLFSLWIIYREKSFLPSLFWIVLVMTLGFFTISVYVFLALNKSKGDWNSFFHGKQNLIP